MTVREWFRAARACYTARTGEERQMLAAVRNGDYAGAEFWALLLITGLVERQRDERGHLWRLDGYTWRCEDCPATIASDCIGETQPPDNYDPECRCAACRPCQGGGQ